MKHQIVGTPLPAVICELEAGETIITERGSMSWMSPNVRMETTTNGGIGKALGRMLAGEAMFQNRFTAEGGAGQIAFASSFPGSIREIAITPDKPVIVQKSSFLAAEEGVQLSIHFQKKLSTGLLGGEGFIMQKLSGQGTAFVEIDGHACEYYLDAGQSIIVNTGYIAMMDTSCSMDIRTVSGAKNFLFGGEGLFHTVVHGPGRVILQTMPVHSIAAAIRPYIPTKSD